MALNTKRALTRSLPGMPLYFSGLLLMAFILNVATLKGGHNWGDDFAQYIIYAKNLLSGQPLTTGIILGEEFFFRYPPGYSFVLAPVIHFFGLNFLLMKFLNVLIWSGMMAGVYLLLFRKDRDVANKVLLLVGFSSMFFVYKQNISSDFLFLLLVVWGIFFYQSYIDSSRNKHFFCFLICAALAVFTRSAGVFLFLSAIFYSVFIRHRRGESLWMALFLLLPLIVQGLLVGFSSGAWKNAGTEFPVLLKNIVAGMPQVLKAMTVAVLPLRTVFETVLFGAVFKVYDILAAVICAAVVCIFIVRFFQKKLTFLDCAFTFYFLLLLVWEGVSKNPVSIFMRYTLPLYPFVIFYLLKCAGFLSRSLQRIFFLLLLLFNLLNIGIDYNFNDDKLFVRDSQDMFAWIQKNTSVDQPLMAASPRAMVLMTGRAVAPLSGDITFNIDAMDRWGIQYLIVSKNKYESDVVSQIIDARKVNLEPIWQNNTFTILRIRSSGDSLQ